MITDNLLDNQTQTLTVKTFSFRNPISVSNPPEMGAVSLDHVFVPNQQVNLNELESDERDIESFKRFNYFFEPPKNKPKVNLNVQDLYGQSRKPDSPSLLQMGGFKQPANGGNGVSMTSSHQSTPSDLYSNDFGSINSYN